MFASAISLGPLHFNEVGALQATLVEHPQSILFPHYIPLYKRITDEPRVVQALLGNRSKPVQRQI